MLKMDGLAEEPPRQQSGFGRPDSRTHLTNGKRNKDFINQTRSEPITASLRSSGLAGRAARVEISPLQPPCSLCYTATMLGAAASEFRLTVLALQQGKAPEDFGQAEPTSRRSWLPNRTAIPTAGDE